MDIKKILFRTNSIDVEKAIPDALILCTKDGKIQWVNDAATEIFETSRMHLLTSNVSDFIENSLSLIENSISMHKPVITKAIEKEAYYDMTVKEIEDGYVLDLREAINNSIETAEEKIEILNNLKNTFLLKLTNDLKSPIQSIVGFSQAMSDGLGGEMTLQQEKYIRIINKNSTELMYFVAKLLELSKTETYDEKIDDKTFDLSSLVNVIIRYNEQLYKDKNVNINLTIDDDFKKTVSSDESILKAIIQDLLEVILKSVDMGDINVKLSNPSDEYITERNLVPAQYTLITLSSSSLLLSEKDLECMFDPYKIIDSTNRKNVLRAIVLASVKNLVQLLNGSVWVETKILKNTTFSVLLPI